MSLKYEHAKHAMPAVDHYEYQPLEQQCCQIKKCCQITFLLTKTIDTDITHHFHYCPQISNGFNHFYKAQLLGHN